MSVGSTVLEEAYREMSDALWNSTRGEPTTTGLGTIFHLTDSDGLRSILSTRTLWASHATGLNDAREVTYAVDLARTILRRRARKGLMSPYEETLLKYLGDVSLSPPGMRWEGLPFVVSFCRRPTKSGQWLHYGRSGRGVALGFDSRALADPARQQPQYSYDMVQIDYSPRSQRTRLEALIDTGASFMAKVPATSQNINTTAGYVAFFIRQIAARFKHPSFREEDEVRLVGQEPLESGKLFVQHPSPTNFRMSSDRLVPYKTLLFDPASVTHVLVGFSSPLSEDAVRTFLAANGIQARVTRSRVPVR